MNGDICLVKQLRWVDVKGSEGRSEQFWTKHAGDIDRFAGSHADANESDFILPVMYPSGSCQAVGFGCYKCAQHAPMACDLRDNFKVAEH